MDVLFLHKVVLRVHNKFYFMYMYFVIFSQDITTGLICTHITINRAGFCWTSRLSYSPSCKYCTNYGKLSLFTFWASHQLEFEDLAYAYLLSKHLCDRMLFVVTTLILGTFRLDYEYEI